MKYDYLPYWLPALVIGITVHEFAHAWTSSLLGDDFPRRNGRVNLSPLRHLSPLGTLMLLFLPFGFGRPVMVNLYNYRHPKRDYLLTSLAGPAANAVVVAAALAMMHLSRHSFAFGLAGLWFMWAAHVLLFWVVLINLILAILNLVPIPPLDGSKIWPCLIPGLRPAFGKKVLTWALPLLLVLLMSHAFDPLLAGGLRLAGRVMPDNDYNLYSDYYASAETAMRKQEYAQAQRLCTEAINLNPYWAGSFYMRACARGYRDDWRGALADVEQAIGLDGQDKNYQGFRQRIREYLAQESTQPARTKTQPEQIIPKTLLPQRG